MNPLATLATSTTAAMPPATPMTHAGPPAPQGFAQALQQARRADAAPRAERGPAHATAREAQAAPRTDTDTDAPRGTAPEGEGEAEAGPDAPSDARATARRAGRAHPRAQAGVVARGAAPGEAPQTRHDDADPGANLQPPRGTLRDAPQTEGGAAMAGTMPMPALPHVAPITPDGAAVASQAAEAAQSAAATADRVLDAAPPDAAPSVAAQAPAGLPPGADAVADRAAQASTPQDGRPGQLAPGQEPAGPGGAGAPVPPGMAAAAAAIPAPSAPIAAPASNASPTPAAGIAAATHGSLAPDLYSPGFAPALGSQVALWVREGMHEARLQLNPAEMGPVQIQIQLEGTAARVDFRADLAATRQVIESSLPALAAALHDNGLTLAGGGVFQGDGGSGDGARPQSSDATRSARGQAADDATADTTAGAGQAAPALRRGLVDLVA